MSHLTDWHTMGIIPGQDFDSRFKIGDRTSLALARMHEPKGAAATPDQRDTAGLMEGAFLVKVANAQREYVHAWFMGAAGGVQSAASKGTATTTGTRVKKSASTSEQWHPILTQGDDPDTRFEPMAAAGPSWFKGKFPKGWTSTVTQGTKEFQQGLTNHPDFWGLVSVNQGGDPKCGTLVHELDKNGRVENSQHLQSIFTVTDLGAGGTCFAGGKAVALQLGQSKQDLLAGFLPMVEWRGDKKVTSIAAMPGGSPFLRTDPGDQHQVGVDADGDPVFPLHFSTHGAIFKGHGGDAPLAFSAEKWQRTVPPADGFWHEVHLRQRTDRTHDNGCSVKGRGLWAMQVVLPLTIVEKDTDPKPPDVLVQPWPGLDTFGPGDPGGVVGPVTGSGPAPVGTTGNAALEIFGAGGTIGPAVDDGSPKDGPFPTGNLNGEENLTPQYWAMLNCLMLSGGLVTRATAWKAGQADLSGAKTFSPTDVYNANNAPSVAKNVGHATGGGNWDDFTLNANLSLPGIVLPGIGSGMAYLAPDETLEEVITGGTYIGTGRRDYLTPNTSFLFGPPRADGTKHGVEMTADGAGDIEISQWNEGSQTGSTLNFGDLGAAASSPHTDGDEPGMTEDATNGDGESYGFKVYRATLADGAGGSTLDIPTPIPVGAVIHNVTCRVVAEFDGTGTDGADTIQVGLAADTNKYSQTLGLTAGSTSGPGDYTTDPRIYVTSSSTGTIRLTANAFTFDGGGSVKVSVQYSWATAPTA